MPNFYDREQVDGRLSAAIAGARASDAQAAAGTATDKTMSPAQVKARIEAVVAAAPGALDTLDELAQALGDDANFAATVTTALGGKQPLVSALSTAALTTLRQQLGITVCDIVYTGASWPAVPAGTWSLRRYWSTAHADAPAPPGLVVGDLWFDYETAA